MKMFKKILFLGFLLLSITALSRAQDVEEGAADPDAPAIPATTTEVAEPADDESGAVNGRSEKTVVDEILDYMKKTCEKIIGFIKGKTGAGSDDSAGATAKNDEPPTDENSTDTDEEVSKDKKDSKIKKNVKKIKKVKEPKEPKDSDEETQEEEE